MYNPQEIEKKWQDYWDKNKTFKTQNDFSKPKYYTLDMFPYPSWAWLHVGHPEGYTANDIVARFKHTKWFNVLHPMWRDAFWLPAENYAIKTGTHPRVTTDANIQTFKKQIKALWFSYDWDREIDTTDPKYYKWTQWIFLKLFEAGLAYEQDLPINYCPSCKTGLANEEVTNDFNCDRCGTKVEKKKIRQWVLAITKYADRLAADVDKLDWPEWIKDMQRNWIWRSEGCEFEMKKAGDETKSISVYTTRIDTVFGMTYAVMAPDHKDISDFITPEQKPVCEEYIEESKRKSDQDRTQSNKEKTWVFTGSYVINPFNNKEIPVYIWDYVLGSYWTWAVMAVPAHDERDFEFACKFGLDIKQAIKPIIYEKNWQGAYRQWVKEEMRLTVWWLVKHPTEDKVLVLDWWDYWWKTMVMWWVENWEDPIEAVKREIIEETWYFDIKSVKKVDWDIESHYFAAHKNIGRHALESMYVVELNSLSKNDVKNEELQKHKPVWIDSKDVVEYINTAGQKELIKWYVNPYFYWDDWILVNSGEFSGLSSEEARKKIVEFAEKNGFWTKKVNYKLRDWLFSRQRYWGEPIPLIHLEIEDLKKLPHISDISEAVDPNLAYILRREKAEWESCEWAMCGCWHVRELVIWQKVYSKIYDWIYGKIICDYNLPLELPQVEKYEPAWDWLSPLATVPEFVNVKLADNLSWKRETNTMPQWWGSCWYYLRYMDNLNWDKLVDPEVAKYWGEVDSYVGWAEHAVLHLLYARFWHKFLFDIWVVPTDEPFYRLRNQWLILSFAYERQNWWLVAVDLVEEKDWKYYEISTQEEVKRIISKMSKSLKNVVNPDDIVKEYGADSLRLYEMYMAEFKDAAPWDTKGIIWVRRFLEKTERLFTSEAKISAEDDKETNKLLHKTIKKVEEDIENYKFNTAIASLMILVNNWLPQNNQEEFKKNIAILLHPFAPHLAEELWERLGQKDSVFNATWPKYNPEMIVDDEITIAIQVNGKLRWDILVPVDTSKDEIIAKAKEVELVKKWLDWNEIIKEIYVPGKLVNIVVK